MIKERERQRQLARKRLMERRRQILEGKEGGAEIDTAPPVIEDDIPENIVGDGKYQENIISYRIYRTIEHESFIRSFDMRLAE